MANPPKKDTEFKRFAAKRIIIGVIMAVAVLWTLGGIMGIIERPKPIPQEALKGAAQKNLSHQSVTDDESSEHEGGTVTASTTADSAHTGQNAHGDGSKLGDDTGAHDASALTHGDKPKAVVTTTQAATFHPVAKAGNTASQNSGHGTPVNRSHDDTTEGDRHGTKAAGATAGHGDSRQKSDASGGHASAVSEAIAPKLPEKKAKGVTTVEAVIAPIEYEIEERFWGWRPNDLINVTDNVNNFQRGVLEVTRRAVVALNERISRTGVTDAFDPDLENATNWFMIKATKYWFPSAESKYSEGIADLKKYRDSLAAKRATFYTRTDNLIPLLASFEDLLGSCDENLVKHVEDDGSEVSWFKADNYFYYAQGVATAMTPILEAIHDDFLITLETRHGIELLHHAVESCHTAAALKPWIITDSHLDGILANHRANMAAPISHARFYLGVLIKALST